MAVTKFLGFEVTHKTKALVDSGEVVLTTPSELRAYIARTEVNGPGYARVRQLAKIAEDWEKWETRYAGN